MFFVFTAAATTDVYTLSLHDALPIFARLWVDGALIASTKPHKGDSGGYDNVEPVPAPPLPGLRHVGFGIEDRKSTRLNSSHVEISYAVFCLKKKSLRHHHVDHAFSTD